MQKRRYREKRDDFITMANFKPNARVHDFIKGWGTICKNGDVLWDYWRPPTKKQRAEIKKRLENFPPKKVMIPNIKRKWPDFDLKEIFSNLELDNPQK